MSKMYLSLLFVCSEVCTSLEIEDSVLKFFLKEWIIVVSAILLSPLYGASIVYKSIFIPISFILFGCWTAESLS